MKLVSQQKCFCFLRRLLTGIIGTGAGGPVSLGDVALCKASHVAQRYVHQGKLGEVAE